MRLNTSTVRYNGVDLNVHYNVDGKYYPATHYEPAEHPDFIIHEINVADSIVDIMDAFFSEDDIDEIAILIRQEYESQL